MQENVSPLPEKQGAIMHVRHLGTDPDSQEGQSPKLFATDRTDRKTYIAQGGL
jgi:hypothetical protein